MFTPHNMSHVMCHVSHVTFHMSCVTCHFFFDNMVKLMGGGLVLNGVYPIQFISVVEKFKRRIDIKSFCKRLPKDGKKYGFLLFKSSYKWVKRGIMKISAKKMDFSCNILGKMIFLHNWCINLCPEKCYLGQIPIPLKEMCSKQQHMLPSQLQHQVFEVEFKT